MLKSPFLSSSHPHATELAFIKNIETTVQQLTELPINKEALLPQLDLEFSRLFQSATTHPDNDLRSLFVMQLQSNALIWAKAIAPYVLSHFYLFKHYEKFLRLPQPISVATHLEKAELYIQINEFEL